MTEQELREIAENAPCAKCFFGRRDHPVPGKGYESMLCGEHVQSPLARAVLRALSWKQEDVEVRGMEWRDEAWHDGFSRGVDMIIDAMLSAASEAKENE